VIIGAAPFWDITQPKFVIPYRRFGITYVSKIQGPKIQYYTHRAVRCIISGYRRKV